MNIQDLINDGWARHEKEAAALAEDLTAHAHLATEPGKAVPFLALATHTIGFHLKDWPRARTLAELVVSDLPAEADSGPAWGNLAVARFMAGDAVGALAAECRAAELAEGEPVAAMVRARILLASELVDADKLEDGARIYTAAVALARSREEKLACDRAIAVTSNNLASGLLEKTSRSPEEDALMLRAAEAAREFWLKAGTWMNEERAEYLLALVKNALNQPDAALEHAARGLEVIARNGEEVVDEAFLNLAAARAYGLQGDADSQARSLTRADELAEAWTDDGLKSWFAAERSKIV